jgi:hypothetical protein
MRRGIIPRYRNVEKRYYRGTGMMRRDKRRRIRRRAKIYYAPRGDVYEKAAISGRKLSGNL